jgi:Ca2+-binding EF-hand superfamily protein
MTFYLFGIAFTAGVSDHLDQEKASIAEGGEGHEMLLYFGTVDRSILTLFMAMSGGNDWAIYYSSLLPLPNHFRMAFLLFITFSTFAVVNIVTGVFVESALAANQTDRDVLVHEETEKRKEFLAKMQELFEEMDEDARGTITFDEFEAKLGDDRVIAYFSAMKLDVSDAVVLFRLLDYDQSDEISIEEFVIGCYKLQGESRSLDTKIMQYEMRFLQEAFTNMMESIVDIRNRLDSADSYSQTPKADANTQAVRTAATPQGTPTPNGNAPEF